MFFQRSKMKEEDTVQVKHLGTLKHLRRNTQSVSTAGVGELVGAARKDLEGETTAYQEISSRNHFLEKCMQGEMELVV